MSIEIGTIRANEGERKYRFILYYGIGKRMRGDECAINYVGK